ncbi:MAG: adenylate kinase [Candidatus Coatesbacteria bacterium]|nr:MAG: adenylate kinase [Candidatus Coatesbacteria bacterium]
MQLVLIGPPGAGKGTIAARLAARFGLVHLSTGDLLREASAAGTPLGEKTKAYVDAGRLVPQEILGEVVAERVRGERAFVLDGYPRTVEQAEFLAALPAVGIAGALYVAVPEGEIVRRLAARVVCASCGAVGETAVENAACPKCGGTAWEPRPDDRPETVAERYAVYMQDTAPVIDYYRDRGLLVEIDGKGDREEVWARVEAAVAALAGDDDNG